MNEEEISKYMESLKESNDKQASYAKKQYHMSVISCACCVVMVIVVLYTSVTMLTKLNSIYGDLQVSIQNIESISDTLASSDLDGMISDVEKLVNSSQTNLDDAAAKIDSIDIATLNKAIKDLSDVVDPFAKFFGQFK